MKTTQKTWQRWILRQTTSLLHLIENIFSAEEMLSQFQNSITEIHDVCSYCCKAWGSCVCYTDKGGIVERTSHATADY